MTLILSLSVLFPMAVCSPTIIAFSYICVNATQRANERRKQPGFVDITGFFFNHKLSYRRKFFTRSGGNFELQKNRCGHIRPRGIEPVSRVGQVLTQGQWPALMTIDNNLSLFDFQPNSLSDRGSHCLKTAGNKWSGRIKALRKHPSVYSQYISIHPGSALSLNTTSC